MAAGSMTNILRRTRELAFALVSLGSCSVAATVEHVEPPNWWLGLEHSQVELLLGGSDLIDVEIESLHPQVDISSQHNPGNGHSHFVTLDLGQLNQPDAIELSLRYADGHQETLLYHVEAQSPHPLKGSGFDSGDFIYLLTPDRFANADPSNDSVERLRESRANRAEPYGRHGGDLKGIQAALPYLSSLGVTRLWMNPILENDMPESSYHGYAITDLYRVDPRFGTLEDLSSLSHAAAEQGIGLVWDAVPNHIGRHHPWLNQPPEDDWINPEQSSGISNHRREALLDYHRVEADVAGLTHGWFVPAMPDLNQRNPRLARYLLQNMIWWVERLGLSAIRVDTMPYNEREFMRGWLAGLMAEYPNLSIVGEEWSYQPPIIAQWQVLGSNSMMDFPLTQAITQSLQEEESWNSGIGKLYQVIASDWLYPAAEQLVIFPDNHDMSRIHTALGEDVRLTRMALSLVATLRGVPQIFYGTEILLSHPGTDSHGALRMDFPGGWPGDPVNGFTGEGLSSEAAEFQRWFKALFQWRRNSSAIATGTLKHLAPRAGVYAYVRESEEQRVLVLVNNNREEVGFDLAWLETLTSLEGNWSSIASAQSEKEGKEDEMVVLTANTRIPGKTVWILEQR